MSRSASTFDGSFSEYQIAKRFPAGPFYVSLYYRWAVDKHGRRSVSPFSHASCGTMEYREIKVWRFAIGVATPYKLFDRLGGKSFIGGKRFRKQPPNGETKHVDP